MGEARADGAVVAVVADLLFDSKLSATAAALGAPLVVVRIPAAALAELPRARRLIVDLNLAAGDPSELIATARRQHPDLEIVGFFSHVQVELKRAALAAGATTVLPRSVFVERLPQLLATPDGNA